MDILLELADGLGREGVADDLALASVLNAVAGVEETTADRDESVVVFAVLVSEETQDGAGGPTPSGTHCHGRRWSGWHLGPQ